MGFVEKNKSKWVVLWVLCALAACGAALLNPYLGYSALIVLAMFFLLNLGWLAMLSFMKNAVAKQDNPVGQLARVTRFMAWPLFAFVLAVLATAIGGAVHQYITRATAFGLPYAPVFYRFGLVTLAGHILCMLVSQVSYCLYLYLVVWKAKW